MLLRKWFSRKRTKPKTEVLDKKSDEPAQKSEEPSKRTDANVTYPFKDVKATSFPPPLSLDASVYTDPQTVTTTHLENQKGKVSRDKNGKEIVQADEKEKKDKVKEEIKDDKKLHFDANGICDLETCTKEKCSPETCEKPFKKSRDDSNDKISPVKLTEMINSSIKEAMQIIVKECRMQDEEQDLDKKSKKEHDKSICYNKETVPVKVKHDYQPRAAKEEQLNDRARISKSIRLQEKYNNVRCGSKKLHEESGKSRSKNGNLSEEVRNKRHSKSANVKTDNRRMTGNVNIYICSEATENAQAIGKQKKAQPCTESGSETTTERSRISSSKLVTCIRNKRRKSREQNSLDFLPNKEESSENSTTYSCISKYTDSNSATKLESSNFIDGCKNIDSDVCVKNTEPTLSSCECNDTNISSTVVEIDKSDLSFEKSKFVVCNKIKEPCSTIYPTKNLSNSESEEWSSKSVCSSRNADCIPSDAWSLEPNLNYHTDESEKHGVSKRILETVCKCNKKDRELIDRYNERCNCRNKKRFSKTIEKEPWSICNCITEEEEEDVCVNVKSEEFKKSAQQEKKEITVCHKTSEDLKESKFVTCKREFPKDTETLERGEKDMDKKEISKSSEEEQTEKFSPMQTTSQRPKAPVQKTPMLVTSPKLIRPETVVLKNILKQQSKPTAPIDRENVSPIPVKEADTSEQPIKDETNSKVQSPVHENILKKFNLRKEYILAKQQALEKKQTSPREENEETLEKKIFEEKSNEKTSEDKDNGKEKDTKNLQEKLKESFLFKNLKKIVRRAERISRSESKPDRSMEKDNIAEPKSSDVNTDKKVEIPKTETDKSEFSVKSKTGMKETHKEKEKLITSKIYSYIPKMKKDKPKPNTVTSVNPTVNEKNKNAKKNNPTINTSGPTREEMRKNTKEEIISGANKEKQNKLKLSTPADGKNLPALLIQDADNELMKQEDSEKHKKMPDPREIVKKREIHESLKKPQVEKKPDVQEKKEAELQKNSMREDKPAKKMNIDMHYEKETAIPCMQPQKLESHTICTNSKYAKHASGNECFTTEESACNCCYSPIPRCNNEPISYPKSCLKKERQCCHIDSQENGCSIPCHDKRNWEECGCRRIIVCNGCCRPRNECSCRRTCVNCYKPKNKCNCKSTYETKNNTCGCMKSMFCLYCDNPRDKCTCRAPVRKCLFCELSIDLCMCKDQKTICDGRPVLTEPDNDRTMYVTAWKPREEVRRYFSRNLADLRTDSINECCCCEKLKSHNSDDLPYQRLSVFSDVMDELQQKMSESTCCTRCKKIPCCCNITAERGERREDKKIKYCISPKTRRKIIAVCMEKSRNKPSNNCKCESGQAKSDKQKKIIVTLCCACKATPCRCKKLKSNQKKPKAKCYYCKSSPCICIAARERNKSRPCRCTDSPCRTKEKESTLCGKTSTKPKNNDEKTICVR